MPTDTTNRNHVRIINFDQLEPYLNRSDDTIYLLNFWATWCLPCRKEMPVIKAIENKYKYDKFKVMLVSLDFPRQLESNLIPYLKSNNITSEVVILNDPDQNRWIDRVDKNWTGEIPFTIIYSKGFRESYSRSLSFEMLDSIISSKIHKK